MTFISNWFYKSFKNLTFSENLDIIFIENEKRKNTTVEFDMIYNSFFERGERFLIPF